MILDLATNFKNPFTLSRKIIILLLNSGGELDSTAVDGP